MVNKFLLTICGLIALVMVVWNGPAVFTEQEISEGQRVFENFREKTAGNDVSIQPSQKDAKALVKFIEASVTGQWKIRFFVFLFSMFVLIAVAVILMSEKKKDKNVPNKVAVIRRLGISLEY